MLFLVLARASFLELGDLIDPTESRYAVIAQEMLSSGDWLTPQLPSGNGLEPYLGKPPLHFWLTALSYKFLGVEEWTARLPSFFLALGCMALAFSLSRKLKNSSVEEGLLAALIAFVSPLFFLFAGASAVDMTLSFFVLLASTAFAFWVDSRETPAAKPWALLLALALALGVLTKGPVAIALPAMAILPWLFFTKQFSLLKQLPWIGMSVVFVLVAFPWFILSGYVHPDFYKYFFWNENVARYFVHEYGDRYGSGHQFPRGAAWIMLFVGIFPWGLVLIESLLRSKLRKRFFEQCKQDQWFFYALLVGLAPVLFFSLVRQLHTAYVLPGVPALAVILARMISLAHKEAALISLRIVWILSIVLGLVLLLSAPWIDSSGYGVLMAIGFLVVGLALFLWPIQFSTHSGFREAFLLGSFLLMLIPMASNLIDSRKSTENVLKEVLQEIDKPNPKIGIAHKFIYSPFWLESAWAQELGERARIDYVDVFAPPRQLPKEILFKIGSREEAQAGKLKGYVRKLESGRWVWYSKTRHN